MREERKLPDNGFDFIAAIRKRDKKVFEALYKMHYKALYTLSYRYIGQHEIAEEMVHDVFVGIWNKAENINIETSVKSYLTRSVINATLNYIKKEKNEVRKQGLFAADYDREVLGSEELYTEREQLYGKLERALEALPPQCKKVMIMSRFNKMKQQEIADSLNISIKTVKNHLTYGINKLRLALIEGPMFILLLMTVASIAIAMLK